jgi:hypothetical protein
MTKKSAVVEALLDSQAAAEAAGLERLIRHYNLETELGAIIDPLGIPCDLRNGFVSGQAWRLVGPKIAAKNRVYLGEGRKGRPPKAGPIHSDARAELVGTAWAQD